MIKAGANHCEVKLNLPIKGLYTQRNPLYVKVLQLDQIILVSMDVTSIPQSAIYQFKKIVADKTNLKEENIIISATHSFSSPHFNNDENMEPFKEALLDALNIELKECTIGYMQSECSINVQRNIQTNKGYWIGRNEVGYHDPQLQSVFLYHDQIPFAVLVNYDLQSSCIHEIDKSIVSSDIPGTLSDLYRKDGIECFYLPGACADMVPKDTNVEELGKELFQSIQNPSEKVPLNSVRCKNFKVVLQKQEMKYATKDLVPHLQYDFKTLEEYVEIPITLLQLNDLVLCMTSVELNSRYGNKIKNMMGNKCCVVTMVNGANKYLPEESDYQNITYMAMNTEIARGSDVAFMKQLERIWKNENWTK